VKISAFDQSLLVLAFTAALACLSLGMAPASGGCAGTGSGSGQNATLSCSGECTQCEDPHLNGNENLVCSCTFGRSPACCHVELENPYETNSNFIVDGDCANCNTTGQCTLSQGENKQAYCAAAGT